MPTGIGLTTSSVVNAVFFSYGVVLKKLQLTDGMALSVLVESVTANPLHWGAWLELAVLVSDRDMARIAVVLPL